MEKSLDRDWYSMHEDKAFDADGAGGAFLGDEEKFKKKAKRWLPVCAAVCGSVCPC